MLKHLAQLEEKELDLFSDTGLDIVRFKKCEETVRRSPVDAIHHKKTMHTFYYLLKPGIPYEPIQQHEPQDVSPERHQRLDAPIPRQSSSGRLESSCRTISVLRRAETPPLDGNGSRPHGEAFLPNGERSLE